MKALKRIFHATGLSDLSANAFHAAHPLAPPHGAVAPAASQVAPGDRQGGVRLDAPEPSAEEIREQLGALLPEVPPVRAEALVENGRPAEAIVRVAKQSPWDLFVPGTHGRTGLGRLSHANVADHATRSAPCPVLAPRNPRTAAPEPPAAPQAPCEYST
jgi:nucleotide-binding universal stress UspA family protein